MEVILLKGKKAMCILSYICDIVHTSRNSLELTGSRSAPTYVPGSRPDVKYCCEIYLHRMTFFLLEATVMMATETKTASRCYLNRPLNVSALPSPTLCEPWDILVRCGWPRPNPKSIHVPIVTHLPLLPLPPSLSSCSPYGRFPYFVCRALLLYVYNYTGIYM